MCNNIHELNICLEEGESGDIIFPQAAICWGVEDFIEIYYLG